MVRGPLRVGTANITYGHANIVLRTGAFAHTRAARPRWTGANAQRAHAEFRVSLRAWPASHHEQPSGPSWSGDALRRDRADPSVRTPARQACTGRGLMSGPRLGARDRR